MSQAGVPYLELTAEFAKLRDEWFAAIDMIGSKAAFILGDAVTAFEQQAAEYIGSKYALGVANGTDALVLSLRALGIGPGDEVITSPFTFFATAESISLVGATPVFADVDAESFNLDPQSVVEKITEKTRVILPVHIFGHPADMGALQQIADQYNLVVIEDAAQAFGARSSDDAIVGSLGATGCFSFYPAKTLGCYGDGGLISTSDESLLEHLKQLRNHGAVAPFTHTEIGYNSRLDAIQASLLSIKLKKFEADMALRQQIAEWYDERLSDSDAIPPSRPKAGRHAFNLYTIRHPRRDALRDALTTAKIGTNQCYPAGLHLQQVYSHLGYQQGDLPVVDQLCTETLSLPIFPGLGEEQVELVCEVVKNT
jgi:dTDP-4-amino-4,6-dideoxygalactose transaminase